MLHIATPIFRPELLEKVYESIPKHIDIVWHLAQTISHKVEPFSFLGKDSRIRFYVLNCDDSDTVYKRNYMFDNIRNGYFYLLDDDTTLHPRIYELYKELEAKDFIGMLIGNQVNRWGAHRLHAAAPVPTGIDTGNVISHSSVLKQVRWFKKDGTYNDFYFWDRCYKFFGEKNVILLDETISVHNALR